MSRLIRQDIGFLGSAALLLAVVFGPAPATGQTTFKLYYLGGQSNMDGYGYVSELPTDLRGMVANVRIFHGNQAPDDSTVDGRGLWSQLQPGHGVGFSTDGEVNNHSDRFGVELTFARRLKEQDPEANIAIVKYSRGGTSIDASGEYGCWDPDYGGRSGINQYDHFLATVRNALAADDIDGDGVADILIPAGIIWMQGESDAMYSEVVARRYLDHLTRLMNLIRAAFRIDDMPVVIGRITDSGRDESGQVWEHAGIVRAAQAAFVEFDDAAALVTSTDEYEYSDPWHYDTAGFIDLGRRSAEAVLGLQGGG